jgi:hypothetical protein
VARRPIRALRPYGDDSTFVGEALRRAAADLGIDADGRSFDHFAGVAVAAPEATGGAAAG